MSHGRANKYNILREQGIGSKILGETRVSSPVVYYSNVKRAFPSRKNLALEGKNHYRGKKYSGRAQLQINADMIHMVSKLQLQIEDLHKTANTLRPAFIHY